MGTVKPANRRHTFVELLEERRLLTVSLGTVSGQVTLAAPKGGSQLYQFDTPVTPWVSVSGNGHVQVLDHTGAVIWNSNSGSIPFSHPSYDDILYLKVSGETKPTVLTVEPASNVFNRNNVSLELDGGYSDVPPDSTYHEEGWVGDSYKTNYYGFNLQATSRVNLALRAASSTAAKMTLLDVNDHVLASGNALSEFLYAGNYFIEVSQTSAGKSTNYDLAISSKSTPVLQTVTPPVSQTYALGSILYFTAKFNRPVLGGGAIQFVAGGVTRWAYSIPAAGQPINQIVFTYTVQAGDLFSGITSIGPFSKSTLITNAIWDAVPAITTFKPFAAPGVVVNAIVPTVTSIIAPAAGTYLVGQQLVFTVNFSQPVFTSLSTAGINLNVGVATYLAGSGTQALTFGYTVRPNDSAPNGVSFISPDVISVGIASADGTWANTSFIPFAMPSVVVDGTVASVATIGVPSGLYSIGQQMTFTVTFTGPVYVTGSPVLNYSSYGATYAGGSGTNTLSFVYTVKAGDKPVTAIPTISLNGADIVSQNGNEASVVITATNAGILAEGTAPTLYQVVSPLNLLPGQSYVVGQTLYWNALFGSLDGLVVTGNPQLALTFDGGTRMASYVGLSDEWGRQNGVVFAYTLQPGDQTAGIAPGAISLNGGSITDDAGNLANLTAMITAASANPVTNPPTGTPFVQSISFVGSGVYHPGDMVYIQAVFSSPVVVSGTPQIACYGALQSLNINYLSGSGTTTLIFAAQIPPNWSNYIVYGGMANFNLNGGSIVDATTSMSADLIIAVYPGDTIEFV